MKVTFRPVVDGSLVFNLDAADDVTLFEKLAHIQEIFGDTCCGCCKGTNLRFRVRKAKNLKNQEFNYFERVCLDCNAKLDYGQNREGRTLFSKRTIDKNGRNVYDYEHNGWYVYEQQPLPKKQVVAVQEDDEEDPPF